jgi:hypothetical protein
MRFIAPLLLLALVSACLAIPVSFGNFGIYNSLFGIEKPLKSLSLYQIVDRYQVKVSYGAVYYYSLACCAACKIIIIGSAPLFLFIILKEPIVQRLFKPPHQKELVSQNLAIQICEMEFV